MTELLGPVFQEALTIIGILLNVIIGLLLYIFNQQVARTKEDVLLIKTVNEKHEIDNKEEMGTVTKSLDGLRSDIVALHVALPSEYVKQSVLASMQLDLKADMRSVFNKMDEMKDMLINMGADRRIHK